jgi:hypothetical protein
VCFKRRQEAGGRGQEGKKEGWRKRSFKPNVNTLNPNCKSNVVTGLKQPHFTRTRNYQLCLLLKVK